VRPNESELRLAYLFQTLAHAGSGFTAVWIGLDGAAQPRGECFSEVERRQQVAEPLRPRIGGDSLLAFAKIANCFDRGVNARRDVRRRGREAILTLHGSFVIVADLFFTFFSTSASLDLSHFIQRQITAQNGLGRGEKLGNCSRTQRHGGKSLSR